MGGYRFRSSNRQGPNVQSPMSDFPGDFGPWTLDSLFHRHCSVQIQIKLQHVYNCFAQKAELSTLCVRGHELMRLILANASLSRDTWHLKLCSGARNVGVKTRTRGCH